MTRIITLAKWAREAGLSRMTAFRRAREGRIPGAFQAETGFWRVRLEDPRRTVAYCRVSSHDQKGDLDRQIARIAQWAAGNSVTVHDCVSDIGSGLSETRRGLLSLLGDASVGTIIVEHRDRLARFGVAQLEAALAAQERRIIVLDTSEVQDELVRDMMDLMTCFSARLYGRRSARNRALRAAKALADGADPA